MATAISRDSSRFVSLFQKAHGCIANVQRLDDQIAALFEQRRKILEDMRALQTQINSEFDRMLELDRVVPADTLLAGAGNAPANGKPREAKPADPRISYTDSAAAPAEEEPPSLRLAGRPLTRFQTQILEPLKP